jgi:hypothetical protein
MKSFSINYKDHLGRKNHAVTYAENEVEAKKKFETLHPTATIVSVLDQSLIYEANKPT